MIVAGSAHEHHVAEYVPDWWGIITVKKDEKGKLDFYILRESGTNPKVKPESKVSILWRQVFASLLDADGTPFIRTALIPQRKAACFDRNGIIRKQSVNHLLTIKS